MNTRLALGSLALLAASALPASAQWLHTFDSQEALDREFAFVSTSASPLQHFNRINLSEGLLRSGSLGSPQNGGAMSALIRRGEGFSPLTPAWRCAVFFRYATPHASARSGPFFGFGAVRSDQPANAEVFNLTTHRAETTDAAFIGLRALLIAPTNPGDHPGVLQIGLQSYSIPGEPKTPLLQSPPTSAADGNLLVAGRWYHLQLDVSHGAQGYDLELTLHESDHEGRIGRTLLSVLAPQIAHPVFAAARRAHPFLALHSSSLSGNHGLGAVDNFSCSALPPSP
jgi:hypothetical protein